MTDQAGSPPNGERMQISPTLSKAISMLTKEDFEELERMGFERASAALTPPITSVIGTAATGMIAAAGLLDPPTAPPRPAELPGFVDTGVIVVEADVIAPPATAEPVAAPPVAADPSPPAPPVAAPPPPAAATPTPAVPAAVAAPAKRVDEHDIPVHMALLRPQYFFWSIDAILKSEYEWIDEEGKVEKRYWPLQGLLLGRAGEGSSSLMILTYRKVLASNYAGKIAEVPAGSRVIFSVNQHTCELFRVLKDSASRGGKPHVILKPTGFETMCDGSREMCFKLGVEPDPKNPAGYKIISDESAIGPASLDKAAA